MLLDSKIPELNIRTQVTSSVISVFVDSRTGYYDVAISNFEGELCFNFLKISCIVYCYFHARIKNIVVAAMTLI